MSARSVRETRGVWSHDPVQLAVGAVNDATAGSWSNLLGTLYDAVYGATSHAARAEFDATYSAYSRVRQ